MNNTLRISLNAASFPFLYKDALRSTILTGIDQNVRYAAYAGTGDSVDWGVPSIQFMENIIPSTHGLISVQYTNLIPATGFPQFDQAFILRDEVENTTVISPANGLNKLLDPNTGTWHDTLSVSAANKIVTQAYTQGRAFLFYERTKLFEYDGVGATLIDRTSSLVFPAGFSISDIRGITGVSNYLILFTDIEVLWSSPSDPLNFDRSTNNGSGYQIPEDARGRISCIFPVSGGAIIYTVRNAVAVTFTNVAATPFVFRGISNSGGVASPEQVAYDADEKYQYVWSSGGLQQVTLQIANGVFPEVTDFLTAGLYETFSYGDKQVLTQQLGGQLSVKMTFVAQRYLCISYGPDASLYTYCLIYDTILQRWGKLKKDHVDCFTYPYPAVIGDLDYAHLIPTIEGLGDASISDLSAGVLAAAPPRKSVAFLSSNGTIDALSVDYKQRQSGAVLIVGNIQHNRDRLTTLHKVEVDSIDQSAMGLTLTDLISMNGRTTSEVREYWKAPAEGDQQIFLGDAVAKAHQLCFTGTFQMNNLIIRVAKHGRA